jgi:hypothetical protein
MMRYYQGFCKLSRPLTDLARDPSGVGLRVGALK